MHKVTRESDEYVCSCGLRWATDEADPHPSKKEQCLSDVRESLKKCKLTREQRAEQLIRDLFMKCRESQNINQYNPYTWAELNPKLMQRIKEFM